MTPAGERAKQSRAYKAGFAIALATSLAILWTTIVHDDGNGIGFFLLVMAAAIGAFAAWFSPSGMARTMVGVAVMQAWLGMAIATAPSTATVPDGSLRALLSSGVFAVLWLISASFFRAASRKDRKAAEAADN